MLAKRPPFVPTPSDINCYEVRKDFTKFINKVRKHAEGRQQQQQLQTETATNPQVNSEDLPIDEINFPLGKSPLKTNLYQQLYRSRPSKHNSLELFIDSIEKELFNPNNIRKTRNSLKKEEMLALSEMKSREDKIV